MDVHITFTGLHLFALDPDGSKFHMLMPVTSDPHQHRPSLSHNRVDAEPLHHREVNLVRLKGDGRDHWPLQHVLDVENTGGRKVALGQIGPNPNFAVAARVVLPRPTRVIPGRRVLWAVPGNGIRPLTHELTWVIQNVDEEFDLEHRALRGAGSTALPWPDPEDMSGRPVRSLWIDHLPDHPHCIEEEGEADHVQWYYTVTGGVGGNPVLKQRPVPGCDPERLDYTREERRSLAFNCMLGQSGVG